MYIPTEASGKLLHRIKTEQKIVRKTVSALLDAGFFLRVNDRVELRPEQPTRDRAVIIKELMETDDEFLEAHYPAPEGNQETPMGYVYFGYGNDGYDVISDYTTNLEDVLEPVNAYAEKLETGGR
jgi:hypothetical protein